MKSLIFDSFKSKVINGLRGFAVLSVIFFHAKLDWFSNGYLGVDIFFVISGYLVTRIILSKEIFNYLFFLLKRLKRLAPALLLTLLISTLFSFYFLLPDEQILFAKSLISNLFLIPNMYFLKANSDYFKPISYETPLLHTWSLGIEYSFYFIFPIIMIVLKKFKLNFNIFLLLILFLSLLFSQIGGNFSPRYPYLPEYWNFNSERIGNFYFFPSRIWQFLIGSLVFLNQNKFLEIQSNPKISNLIIFVFTILLIFCIFNPFQENFSPKLNTLVTVICTAIIIFFSNSSNKFAIFFSNKILIFFGLISFSLYLIHHPILSFYQIYNLGIKPNFSIFLLLFLVIVIFAYFQWKYIENVFRSEKCSKSIFWSFLIFNYVIIFLLALHIIANHGFPDRLIDEVRKIEKYLQDDDPNVNTCRGVMPDKACVYGDLGSKKAIAIWGDSHMNQLSPIIRDIVSEKKLKMYEFTMPSCPPILYSERSDLLTRNNCSKYANSVIKEITNNKDIKLVLIHGWWEHYIDNKNIYNPNKNASAKDVFRETILVLKKSNKKVIIITAIPRAKNNPVRYTMRAIFFKKQLDDKMFATPLSEHLNKTSLSHKIIHLIKKEFNITIYQPHLFLCESDQCFSKDGENFFYRDDNHISVNGSKKIKTSLSSLISILVK
jgi:peptidoglycan/LPS O-acetylase OafA/YrhL